MSEQTRSVKIPLPPGYDRVLNEAILGLWGNAEHGDRHDDRDIAADVVQRLNHSFYLNQPQRTLIGALDKTAEPTLGPPDVAAMVAESRQSRRSLTKSTLLMSAAGLLSEDGENAEYDRGVAEVVADTIGLRGENNDAVLRLLRFLQEVNDLEPIIKLLAEVHEARS